VHDDISKKKLLVSNVSVAEVNSSKIKYLCSQSSIEVSFSDISENFTKALKSSDLKYVGLIEFCGWLQLYKLTLNEFFWKKYESVIISVVLLSLFSWQPKRKTKIHNCKKILIMF